MSLIRLSIIIPTYNIEKYIEKNIRSLLSLNMKEVEFIYVNDGSTDNTRSILKKYENIDSRIRVIDKKNAGLGAARNTGIRVSKGKYVYFVDGDDILDANELEKSLNIAESNELDMLKGEYRIIDDKGTVLREANVSKNIDQHKIWTGEEWMIGPNKYDIVCADLYRRDYLLEHNLLFAEGVIHEDLDFVIKVIYYAKKIMYSGICIYNYVMRQNSIMHSKNERHYKDAYKAAKRNENFFIENVKSGNVARVYASYIMEQYYVIAHLAVQNGVNLRSCMKDCTMREDIMRWLRNGETPKIRFQYICIKYKLYELYDWAYKLYDKMRTKF